MKYFSKTKFDALFLWLGWWEWGAKENGPKYSAHDLVANSDFFMHVCRPSNLKYFAEWDSILNC